MCGIAGICQPAVDVAPELLHRMCACMEHRGPDARGTHTEPGIGLGMQRLAIIDVAGGDQPIFNESGDVAVILNGEIYNHRQLRGDLVRRGHRFATESDTEVLVHLYEEDGPALVRSLRGMFAFAIWDRPRRRLLLARDRAGKKPLFWARRGDRLSFASEMRALLQDPVIEADVDLRAIDAYLALGYVPAPMSAIKGVNKLPPASTLVCEDGGEPRIERYWRLDFNRESPAGSEREWMEELRRLVDESTRLRLMSEVPLGAFLSGGIDSSAVVGAMARNSSEPVRTFAIGFRDSDFDETAYARQVADRYGTRHTEFVVEPDALSILPALARHYGEPFADASAIPTFQLSKLTSEHVTVALNGDGGDECFAGYGRYLRGRRLAAIDRVPRGLLRAGSHAVAPLRRMRESGGAPGRAYRLGRQLAEPQWHRYLNSLSVFRARDRDPLRTPELDAELGGYRGEREFEAAWQASEAESVVERMQDADIATYLPGDLLPKVDIASMAYSLEARSPLLDHQLMEFAAALPAGAKLRGSSGKWIFRESLRGELPDDLLDRPKMGFGVPLARWFREELRDLPGQVLLDPVSVERGWFQKQEVTRLIDDHGRGAADHSTKLWALIQLEIWCREVLSDRAAVSLT